MGSINHEEKLEQAQKLTEEGRECSVSGGTGGWPALSDWVQCKQCLGAGTSIHSKNDKK